MTKIPFQVVKGKIPQWALERIAKIVSDNDGKWLEIDIKPRKRSLAANRYRWGVVVDTVMRHLNGWLSANGQPTASPEDIDIHIKDKALGIVHKIDTPWGELVITGKLKEKTSAEFEESMECIRAYFAQKGINIPLPRENMIEEDYKHNLERE